MKTSLNVLLLIYIAFLFSCKKNVWKGNTTAKVYLVEADDIAVKDGRLTSVEGDPIEGGEVYLYGGKLSGSGLFAGESLTLLETYTTDEDGYVFIDFKHKDYKDEDYDFYTLRAYAARYYVDDTEYDLKIKEDNEVTIKLVAEAYLNVHVKNVTKQYYTLVVGSFGGSPAGGGEFQGYDVDESTIGTVTVGDSPLSFSLYEFGQSGSNGVLIRDAVHCPAHEVTDYYFEY